MKRILSRLLPGSGPGAANTPAAEPAPEALTYVIGDIHGCLDALRQLLDRIRADADGAPHTLVTLGDYVDRGPDSRGVLLLLQTLSSAPGSTMVCLMGNHDRMLLDFLDDPLRASLWLRAGGRETLTSFGIAEPRDNAASPAEDDLATRIRAKSQALAEAMGEDLTDWLRNRPLWWQSGSLVAVHGLTDPDLAMADQSEETLLWARPGRRLAPRSDGLWVVHGHTITPTPVIRAGHVGIDTGAFAGGPLTAAVFAPGAQPRFLSATGL